MRRLDRFLAGQKIRPQVWLLLITVSGAAIWALRGPVAGSQHVLVLSLIALLTQLAYRAGQLTGDDR